MENYDPSRGYVQKKSEFTRIKLSIYVLRFLIIGVIFFVSLLLFNTITFSSLQLEAEKVQAVEVSEKAISNLQKAVQIKTISYGEDQPFDSIPFVQYRDFIQKTFPLIDSALNRNLINDYSYLYEWKGSDPSLDAVVLMSHIDVVPVDEPTRNQWKAAPFSGEIKDNAIWGRGTLDDKVSQMAIMEGVELLLSKGFKPRRSIYLAFGHDEEIGGQKGAKAIAEYFKASNIQISFVLDEGGFIVDGFVPGIEKPISLINVAEKGYASFELTVNTHGGHSSNPSLDNAIGTLAKAIYDLESNQLEYKMVSPVKEQIEHVGPEFSTFIKKMAFANPWLLSQPILKGLNTHTTTAPTIFNSGLKDNVMPTLATATINFRILQGESVKSVEEHISRVINNEKVKVKLTGKANEPSPVSNMNSESFNRLKKTIKELFPETIVSPGLLPGATDARYFYGLTDNVYRFFPLRFNPETVKGFHGLNEHIQIENYKEIIQFYHRLITNLND